MSIRFKLLLLGLATLVLPWAGCQYVREMEAVLREAERESLAAVAATLAASLRGREDLLYREPPADGAPLGAFDLRAAPLDSDPFLDGFPDEWPASATATRIVAGVTDAVDIRAGVRERLLYLLLEVRDDRVVFDQGGVGALDPAGYGDRIWLAFEGADGAERQVFVASNAPGAVGARRVETRELGREEAVDEPRISGAWQTMAGGYRLELRLPLSMLGTRIGVLVDDRDARGAEPRSFGTLRTEDLGIQGRLVAPAVGLGRYLEQFAQPGVTIEVSSPAGALLGRTAAPAVPQDLGAQRGLLAVLYRRVLEGASERRIVEAMAPIAGEAAPIGRLRVAQSADRWLFLHDRALTRLLTVTLIVSAVAVVATAGFAARLAWRLARLRRASETALTRDGLEVRFPEVSARDELGDVARSFAQLLARLGEYTGYLRTLAGKLAHEIRTPLTIVRSSLDNLDAEPLSPGARSYARRAREGSDRLDAILTAMSAATRVEEAIQAADRVRFDLTEVVRSAVDAYRTAFPARSFAFESADEPLLMDGAPELIVQMLDKLIDNAVDFSPPGARIVVRLRSEGEAAWLDVENPGPPLPPSGEGRVFESLWQSRTGQDSRPHFGLGLYIVRLIAESHGGSARALNLCDGSGVRFSIELRVLMSRHNDMDK